METLESLGEKLETSGDIRAIVRTMKSLSSASIRGYERAVEAVGEYERAVEMGLQVVLRDGPPAARGPAPRRSGPDGLIAIGSDRGLCGRFNDRIAEHAAHWLETVGESDARLLGVVGLRAAARLEALGARAERHFALPGSVAGLTRAVHAMALEIDRRVAAGDVRSVTLAYNRRTADALAQPMDRRLLPVPERYLEELAARPWPARSRPSYRMDRQALFSWLVRQHLFVVIYRGFAESLASEHASRLAAMQSAERNIDERREELEGRYRQKRQETITRELLDVVAGFEAVQGRG